MELEDWTEWKLHPVTIEVMKAVRSKREELMEDWANGTFTTESVDGSKQLNAEALGKVQMLQSFLEMTYEGVTEDAANAK